MKTYLFGFVFFAIMAGVITVSLQASEQSVAPVLRLHRGIFDAETLAATVDSPTAAGVVSDAYAIIQFNEPITIADHRALQQAGVTILEYIPDFAYLVQGAGLQINAAANLPGVYARVPFTREDKLAPALLHALNENNRELGRVQIFGWPDDSEALKKQLETLPFSVSGPLDKEQVLQIASLPAVRWVEPASQPQLLNDRARTIMNVDSVWQNNPFFGNNQIIAIADSGLDTGDEATLSPDFAGRIVAAFPLAPGGDWADQHGHGTHVAGSVGGSGVQSGADPGQDDYINSFAGLAPEAGLVIQGFEVDANGAIIGIPDDYYQLFDQAYQSGARIHSNSWGDVTGPITDTATVYGGYPYGAQRTDEFIWDHPDMAIFTAAGNSGADGVPGPFTFCIEGDGVIDPDSLLSPGTAKNSITVGASESDRNEGPLQGVPWLLLSFCFAAQPIAGDIIANNIDGMAAFSSRGPADDGRSKPDIVAPGVNIISNRSHDPAAGTLWGEYDLNYVYSGGTSMATPLTAGMGALVREWLGTQGATNPSAALLKATLLNTTEDMAPGQYGTDITQEIPYQRPNSVAGWGRASLGFLDPPSYYSLWFDDHTTGLNTNDVVIYTHTITRPLNVMTDTQPLRIMLVWTDPPASLSAATQLVNDLDLVVTGPNGTYYGNDINTGDRLNNVEGIIINTPAIGAYQISISAYNVPIASQPYALVVAGPLTDSVVPTPTPTSTSTNTPTSSNTPTPSSTPTSTATMTPTPSHTPTSQASPSQTPTETPTNTPTSSSTPTSTATMTPTPFHTPTTLAIPPQTPTATLPAPSNPIYLPLIIKR